MGRTLFELLEGVKIVPSRKRRGSKSGGLISGEGQNLAVSFYARVRIVRSHFLPEKQDLYESAPRLEIPDFREHALLMSNLYSEHALLMSNLYSEQALLRVGGTMESAKLSVMETAVAATPSADLGEVAEQIGSSRRTATPPSTRRSRSKKLRTHPARDIFLGTFCSKLLVGLAPHVVEGCRSGFACGRCSAGSRSEQFRTLPQ